MSRFPLFGFIISVLSLVLASGCADDLRSKKLFDSGAGDAVIRFSVENISLTRAEGEQDVESIIDHAYLLFYAKDATVLTANPLAAVKATVSEANPAGLTFKMPLSLEAGTDYQLVAIANADKYVPDGYSTFAEYLQSWSGSAAEARGSLLFYRQGPIQTPDVDCLPMRGVIPDGADFRFSLQNGTYVVSTSLTFRRSVARIDVANIIKEGFIVEGVALCNWRDAASAVSEENGLGNRLGSVQGVLSDDNATGPDFGEMPDADVNGIQQLMKSLYCFPSVTYDSYPSDTESTALIIKAKYGDDAAPSYYRVNVGAQGNRAEVKANTKFLVTIQSVKGRGASTPKEAYAAEESQIVSSVVEDWDLEGSFAMDDKGNFIVLSTGHLEFAGDVVENREIKVLTSKGLTWAVAPEDTDTSDSFNVTNISGSSMAIGPKGRNEGKETLTGKFIVTASTPDGGSLTVNILVEQLPAAEQPYDPTVIPNGMPFALIPTDTDRVSINHDEKTIEIDGFDPNCFNSFIDVPFKVYIKDSSLNSVNISTTLQWPLEGRISNDNNKYFYCQQSFSAFPSGQVKNEADKLVAYADIIKGSISASNDSEIYISVGAMGPDDPAITGRTVTLQASNGESIVYDLTVKPRPCIIDDVILSDDSGNFWLIQDRNIQDFIDHNGKDYVGRDSQGKKRQAYNYSKIYSSGFKINIPFKYENDNDLFSEEKHSLYTGKYYLFGSRAELNSKSANVVSRLNWLSKYSYSEEIDRTSPFYETDQSDCNYEKWIFPTNSVLELCAKNIKVSKMRMYLVSERAVKSGTALIPICCYFPYNWYALEDNSRDSYGYYTATDGVTPDLIKFLCYDLTGGKLLSFPSGITSNAKNQFSGLSRLVRPLTKDELEMYMKDYLGYGSEPHKLSICHPDTYESSSLGWLPY